MLLLGIFIFNLYIVSEVSSIYAPHKTKQPNQSDHRHRELLARGSSGGSWSYGFQPGPPILIQSSLLRSTLPSFYDSSKNVPTSTIRFRQQSASRSDKRQIDLSDRSLLQSNSSWIVNNSISGDPQSNSNYSKLAIRSDIVNPFADDLAPETATAPDSKDDQNKIQTHTNNHQSASLYHINAGNTRHYNTNYHTGNSLNNNNNNKYSLNPNSFGPNINLNYIHSLLSGNGGGGGGISSSSSSISSKPSGHNHKGPLTSLLNSNSYGIAIPNDYSANNYYSLASSLTSYNIIRDSNSNQKPPGRQSQVLFEQEEPTQVNSGNVSLASENTFGPSLQHCGRQQVGYREPRIVGGNSTYEGEFPWAVSIQRHGNHHCGGVIVGKRWILTAAHCVRSQLVGNLLVRTGGHTLSRNSNSINSDLERDYFVEQIVMHGDFSRYDNLTASQMKSSANTNNADIALLRLRNDIAWNEFAWPVCFPHRDSGNFSGHDAIVIGWGKLNEKSEDFSNELQKVKLTIIDNKVCQNWFRQAGREMPIDDRIICAGFKNGGKDACHGDSGGPLLSRINGHYVVVGVVSTGIGCARPLLPGLYSRVSSYIGWIERHVNNQR